MPGSLKSIVLRVANSDPGAFKELFENFSPKIYAFALKLTHSQSTAEELVQEVFLKIWLHRESLVTVDNFPSWLYAICRNLAFNVLKRVAIEHKAKTEFSKGLRKDAFETEETVIYRDYEHILQNAIDRLSPQQKMVYSLCHGEGLKYEEAAEKLHISRLTVKTHMQQALRHIKSHVRSVVSIYGSLALAINHELIIPGQSFF